MTEFYVLEALEALDDVSAAAAMQEVSAFVADLRANPRRWNDVGFELMREAMVRHINEDPFSRVFVACARSLELQLEVSALVEAVGLR